MNRSTQHLALALALANALAASPRAEAATFTTTEATYRCDSSPSGECHFLLYTSTCKEAAPMNGYPSLACTQAYLREFSLKVGESRTLSDLPAGVRQCTVQPGKKSSFPACAM